MSSGFGVSNTTTVVSPRASAAAPTRVELFKAGLQRL